MEVEDKLRKSLHTMLTQAEIDLEMWQAMRNARSDREVLVMINRRYGRFYIAAENALFNSLISILYKAFETRKDTINFWELRRTFPASMTPGIEAELGALFVKIKATWVKVGIVRNNIVGHQSSENSAEEVHRLADITILELEELVRDMQHLLYLIAKYFHDTHVVFNLKGTQSFDNLISDLRDNNSSKANPLIGSV
ncbi:hypothetical protein [Xanthomonas campestris]|uniref:AbiU2 domain-containing protein n=1 Tax=Xanthomonas campestris TaxID=339 RepID=UPI000E32AA08|nr:hypothetical protein [Xanthomonas campestris]MEA9576938.1 hypothetical protein [Xanthomonas campestris]RFF69762.1 hypothetical protein D0A39_20045 [Xanthomonas campestris pv. campestris]